jgi:hypothetical protein
MEPEGDLALDPRGTLRLGEWIRRPERSCWVGCEEERSSRWHWRRSESAHAANPLCGVPTAQRPVAPPARLPARDREGLERMARYLARPPIANDRLSRLDDGRLQLELKRPWRDGTTAFVFTPHELIERLVALVPGPAPTSRATSACSCPRRGACRDRPQRRKAPTASAHAQRPLLRMERLRLRSDGGTVGIAHLAGVPPGRARVRALPWPHDDRGRAHRAARDRARPAPPRLAHRSSAATSGAPAPAGRAPSRPGATHAPARSLFSP